MTPDILEFQLVHDNLRKPRLLSGRLFGSFCDGGQGIRVTRQPDLRSRIHRRAHQAAVFGAARQRDLLAVPVEPPNQRRLGFLGQSEVSSRAAQVHRVRPAGDDDGWPRSNPQVLGTLDWDAPGLERGDEVIDGVPSRLTQLGVGHGANVRPGGSRQQYETGEYEAEKKMESPCVFAVLLYTTPASRRPWPAPARLASLISEYFRDSTTPSAPAATCAFTAWRTSSGVVRFPPALVGMSMSMPG